MSKGIPYLTKAWNLETFFINYDQNGNEWLMDNTEGSWLSRSSAERIMKVLEKYLGTYSDEDIEKMREQQKELWGEHYSFLANRFTKKTEAGFVYLLRNDHDQYKIGKTKKLGERMSNFGLKLPFKVYLVGYIETSDCHSLEKEYHQKYDYCRIAGEWFYLKGKERQEIISHPDFKLVNKELN